MRHFKSILMMFIVVITTSCAGRKIYERPSVIDEKLFRTEQNPADSLSLGAVSWEKIFTDTHLQKYIKRAIQNNLDIQVAFKNVQIAQENLLQSKSVLFPTASLSASYTHSTASLNANPSLKERTYSDLWSATGVVSWEADIWGKLSAQKKANAISLLSSQETQKVVQAEVVATLAAAYYQLLMYDEQQKILEKTIGLRSESLEKTKALKEAGTTNEVAVLQSEAILYNAHSQLVSIQNSIFSLENTISLLMGENPQTIERNSLENQSFPSEFEQGYATQLLENRPDVIRAEYNLINAFELTNVARASLYPSLKLTGQGGFSSLEIEKWFSAQSIFASVMAGITQPIFNQRQLKTQYEIRKISQENALLSFKKTLLTAGKEVSDALFNFKNQSEFIVFKKKEKEAYQKASEYSMELFNSGFANYLEVITAEVNRLNAELNLANAQYIRLSYGITLYKALGGGWR